MPRVRATVTAAVLALSVWAGDASAASPSPSGDAVRTVSVDVIDARTRDLTIESPSVGRVQVRLLLPAGFEERPDTRFPVLMLLHGAGGEYDDWTTETEVEAMTEGTDLLVVMPAAATSHLGPDETGRPGLGTPPDWETFHVAELRRVLEQDWRADGRYAVGGLSLGGYGAVMEAARHPELFRAVAAYSGALDLAIAPGASEAARALIASATELALAARWPEANPVNVVAALDGLTVYVSYGDGEPGPLDSPETDHDELEAWIGAGGSEFVDALEESEVAATVNAYGPGTHSWAYWDRELAASLPLIADALKGAEPAMPTATP